jgi:hypothetical protein
MPLDVFPLFSNQNAYISYLKGPSCPSNIFGMDYGPDIGSQTICILFFRRRTLDDDGRWCASQR